MRWVLKGSKGAVQFLVFTQWMLPHVAKEQAERFWLRTLKFQGSRLGEGKKDFLQELHIFYQPMAADLGYHSRVPMYEGQEPMGSVDYKLSMDESKEGLEKFQSGRTATDTFTPCPYLDGAPCYYDGSGLNAERVLQILIEQGGEAVWKYLEDYYHSTF